ncbi:MAG TPA: hypothetical protein DIW43_14465 [Spongiibacteraceae bacterium]|nr:hypothetical protein [Spongiibacteraceae bacterium]HCS28662.1 hypothetical protein [Spongiibacteraceae bacterium]
MTITIGNKSLYGVHRELEIVVEAFQGLEQLASQCDGHASDVGRSMVPIILQMEMALNSLLELAGDYQPKPPLPRRSVRIVRSDVPPSP